MTDELETIQDHLRRVLDAVHPLDAVPLPLHEAHGLVLAERLTSLLDIPVFDNSAMDGYAVRRTDVENASAEHPVTLEVVADLPAGSPLDPPLRPGQAARIMTGAPIPTDADAVVQQELTDRGTERVQIRQQPDPDGHIRHRGADLVVGDPVLEAGVRLTPYRIAAAAAGGHGTVSVRPAPRVAVVSTGSELRRTGSALQRGQIPESNSLLLAGLAAEAGGTVVHTGTVSDEPENLRDELAACLADGAQLIVLSGGVSVGAYDVVKATLSPLGTVGFHRIAMQPGKPQGFGTIGEGVPVFGLPGNPVSAAVSFEMFVRPALLRLQGAAEVLRARSDAVALAGWRTPPGRVQLMPIAFDPQPAGTGARGVRPATHGGSGSHLVGGLARAEGFAIIPAEVERVHEGDAVSVIEAAR